MVASPPFHSVGVFRRRKKMVAATPATTLDFFLGRDKNGCTFRCHNLGLSGKEKKKFANPRATAFDLFRRAKKCSLPPATALDLFGRVKNGCHPSTTALDILTKSKKNGCHPPPSKALDSFRRAAKNGFHPPRHGLGHFFRRLKKKVPPHLPPARALPIFRGVKKWLPPPCHSPGLFF